MPLSSGDLAPDSLDSSLSAAEDNLISLSALKGQQALSFCCRDNTPSRTKEAYALCANINALVGGE